MDPPATGNPPVPDLWTRYIMALDKITARLDRICRALNEAGVPYALVGGQAVAIWVASKDPAAVRTTKDVDLMIPRSELPRARAAALKANFDYFEVAGVGMFLERDDPNPREGVHLIWAGEKVRAEYPLPSPDIEAREEPIPGKPVVSLPGLLRMKLMANRDHDRTHIRDMIDVGLIDRSSLAGLPDELAARLDALLTGMGR